MQWATFLALPSARVQVWRAVASEVLVSLLDLVSKVHSRNTLA